MVLLLGPFLHIYSVCTQLHVHLRHFARLWLQNSKEVEGFAVGTSWGGGKHQFLLAKKGVLVSAGRRLEVKGTL